MTSGGGARAVRSLTAPMASSGSHRRGWKLVFAGITIGFICGCSAFDDYWDKDPDAFLGPPRI
ncbi:MAG: hypothetical protein R3E12_09175 [Candidatus Eisenbacteria bacterium]